MYQQRLLLPLAGTVAIAMAQFNDDSPPEVTFTDTAQATSFFSEYSKVRASYQASVTADPNYSAYISALPAEEASEISVAATANPDSPDETSALMAELTWGTTLPSLAPSVSSWLSAAVITGVCEQMSLVSKYSASMDPIPGITCSGMDSMTTGEVNSHSGGVSISSGSAGGASSSGSGAAGTISPSMAKWGMPVMAAVAGGIAGAALLL